MLPELEGGDELTYEPTIFRSGTLVGRELLSSRPYFPDESMYSGGKTYEEQPRFQYKATRPNLPAVVIPEEPGFFEGFFGDVVGTAKGFFGDVVDTAKGLYVDPFLEANLSLALDPVHGGGDLPVITAKDVYGFIAEDTPEAIGETVDFAKDVGGVALDVAPLVLMGVMMMVMRQVKE